MVEWRAAVVPPLGRGYLRLVAATTRFRFHGAPKGQPVPVFARPVVWAFWHNRLLGPLCPARDRGIGVVISRSRDGELISRVVARFGYVPLRGSSSRGGARAVRRVIDHLEGGRDVAFTPDGPRGPRYSVQPGLAYLARRTGAPVVPVGVAMSRKWVFGSWDRFQLPLPFGEILLEYGPALTFDPEEAGEGVAEAVRRALVEVTERAEGHLRGGPR